MERVFIALLLLQVVLGAIDTVAHHELMEKLANRRSAALELKLHSARAFIYGALFLVFAWLHPQGLWLALVWALVLVEVAITLWDFVVEDATRLLPPTERVLHTILAVNGGAMFAVYALATAQDWSAPSALLPISHGWASWALTAAALGIGVSALRDGLAARVNAAEPAPRALLAGQPQTGFLISGGTGFIGTALVEGLVAGGHRVTVLSRDPRRAALRFGGRVRCIADTAELRGDEAIDVVVNLAGAPVVGPRWTPARKHALRASRLDTTHALRAWCERSQHKPALWLQASAIGLYGAHARSGPELREPAAQAGDFASELCRDWERAAAPVSEWGVRLTTMRLGLVLHRSGGVLPMLSLSASLGAGAVLGDGKQWFAWVHLDDVLRFVEQAVEHVGMRGPYNLVAPGGCTQAEFTRALARGLHRPAWLRMPAWPLRQALGEMSTMLLDGPKVEPRRLLDQRYRFLHPDLDGALSAGRERACRSTYSGEEHPGDQHGTVESGRNESLRHEAGCDESGRIHSGLL
ncbi:TIGR01777 family oxidoreductase [Lysobacter antibioticus]|uniref:NAD dependent epimerase/dehydratase family protein n=1 Tax=Lysobacter antibioticus TaxID=84531 RepID=A0A0S2FBZ0_LYSAN|nr:TIGR01777 family oxidoreductase [Lysobacter antibioticus]ALN81057.1 NAD dependent epimerase/dehydratase family protein [Lysobacter antibioticus]